MSPSVEPFNEAKYKALMDGLECSEINYKDVLTGSYSARLDSDFYKKDAIAFSKISENWELLSVICPHITSGTTPKDRDDDLKEGVILFKTNDIRNNIQSSALNTQYYYIDLETDRKMSSSSIQGRDVLINIVGASTDVIGRVAFVPKNFDRANITQAMARLRVEKDDIMPEYLFVFLMTFFAKSQTNRIARQTGQYNMNLTEVVTFRVWKPTMDFQKYISKIVSQADILLHNGQKTYLEGEAILSDNLPKCEKSIEKAVAVRTLSSSFLKFGRLDAEYYQPKYDEYLSLIANYKNGYSIIKDEFLSIREICDRSLAEYQYVEIGDVDIGTASASYNTFETDDLPDNAKIITKKNDVLVSTVRPNRGAVAILEDNDLLVSGAFTVLRERGTYKKEVLQVLLRLPLYRDWLLRYNVGTSYPVIKDEDVLNMPIPLFEDAVQKEITAKVQESFALRRQSKQLLEYATQAVEMAIEQGEDVALEWLKDKVG